MKFPGVSCRCSLKNHWLKGKSKGKPVLLTIHFLGLPVYFPIIPPCSKKSLRPGQSPFLVVSQKSGYPQWSSILDDGIFPCKPSSYGGIPMTVEPQRNSTVEPRSCDLCQGRVGLHSSCQSSRHLGNVQIWIFLMDLTTLLKRNWMFTLKVWWYLPCFWEFALIFAMGYRILCLSMRYYYAIT